MIGKKLAPNRHEINLIHQMAAEAVAAGKKPSPKGIAKILNMYEEPVKAHVEDFLKDREAPKMAKQPAKEGKVPVK